MKAHVPRRVFRAPSRLGLALLALPALAGAADLPMELSRADAGVQVTRAGKSLPAQPGMALQPLDVLMTNGGRASLQMQGTGLIQAGPGTEVILHSGEGGGAGRASVARLQLLKGPLHVESRAGGNRLPPDVRLNIGTGPSAIRSRIYGATVEAQNAGTRQTVCLSDGAVEAQINGAAQRVDSVGQCLELNDGTLSRPALASRPELIPGGPGASGLDAAPAIETSAQARARVQPLPPPVAARPAPTPTPVAAPPSVTTTTTTTVATSLPAPVLPVPGTLNPPPAAHHPRAQPPVAAVGVAPATGASRPVVGDPYSGRSVVADAAPKPVRPAHAAPEPALARPAARAPEAAPPPPPPAPRPVRPAAEPKAAPAPKAPREREVARAEPTVAPPKAAKAAPASPVGPVAGGADHYALIVGSLPTREAAEAESARFKKKGIATTVEEAGPNRFRLRAGSVYDGHAQAAAEQARLQAKGVAGWINPR